MKRHLPFVFAAGLAAVKNGEWVSIVQKTDNNGHKTVTVTPAKNAARSQ